LGRFPNDRQLDIMDCGPACLKMIAKFYGKFYSLSSLREKCNITKDGVSFLDLTHAAEEIGLRTLAVRCSIDDLCFKVPLPAIIHWEKKHFVVLYKVSEPNNNLFRSKTRLYVSDPFKGYSTYNVQDFSEKWLQGETQGALIAIEPQTDFIDSQKENGNPRRTLRIFLEYFKPFQKSFANLFVVMSIVTLLQGILPFISKAIIDVGIQTNDVNFINMILVANVAIIISIMLSNLVRDWILLHITSRVNVALISDYLIKLLRLPITFFESKMTGDILQRAQDHERIRSFIMNNSLNMIFSTLTFVIFGVVMFFYNPVIFYIFLLGSGLYTVWVIGFLGIRKKLDWEYFDLVSQNQSYWVETVSSIQDIKINNFEKQRRWKWEGIQARIHKVNIRVLNITNFQSLGAQFIDSLKNLLITFFCAKAVLNGEITFGVMISTQFIIGMLNAPVVQFIQFLVSFQFAKISYLRLNEIHELEDEHESVSKNNLELPENKSIIVKNVSFFYSQIGPPVLKGVNLVIPEGKVTAIVGDSGSGKTTLLKLLLRLYKPTHGELLIGSMNINNIGLRQWRERCGAVLQDGQIFNDTILNNIILGDGTTDYIRLRNAVSVANIADEIERLPLGYETVMGEHGKGLSGGQKQRILIARALYKDPDYLFFDEATNSLDSINEQKIVSSLNEVFREKTAVVIAHRLSTIQKADQIIVMHQGSVVEIGNHISLMNNKKHYYKLVHSQLQNIVSERKVEEITNFVDNSFLNMI
jgi:ATP-binding cassette subfamily B protein